MFFTFYVIVHFLKMNLIEKRKNIKAFYIKNTPEHSITYTENHVQDIDDKNVSLLKILERAELIKLEIENITNIEDLDDISGEISLNDGIKNSHQESKQSHSLQSIGKLLSENENLESNCKII